MWRVFFIRMILPYPSIPRNQMTSWSVTRPTGHLRHSAPPAGVFQYPACPDDHYYRVFFAVIAISR
jgi:hypothetical protein